VTLRYYPSTILMDGPPPLARGGNVQIASFAHGFFVYISPTNPNLTTKHITIQKGLYSPFQLVDKGIDKLTSGCRKGCRSRELSVVGVQRYDRGTIRG